LLEILNKNIMNLFYLTKKTALITGASGGLGERFARALSAAGARVILTARRVDKLKAIAAELRNSLAIEMDVSNKESVLRVFEHLEEAGEIVDICVNNAGIGLLTSVFEPDESGDFERIIQTNVMGVWYVTKAVARHMKSHGIEGSIINIGSINGAACPAFGGSAYNASKAAVIQITKGLVGELSPHRIRINSISPGFFKTELNKDVPDEILKKIPLGAQNVDPSDLDATILYLASNKASRYVTGACLTIDGGLSWGGLMQ
jgi:NAD(P)-dependent dehydrogenase (short-subunit alcohol dehydrogenase family)